MVAVVRLWVPVQAMGADAAETPAGSPGRV